MDTEQLLLSYRIVSLPYTPPLYPMYCVPASCHGTCVQSRVARQGPICTPTSPANSSPIVVKFGVKVGVGNIGDEYCEEGSGEARAGDRKYPVSQMGVIRGHGARTNGELQ